MQSSKLSYLPVYQLEKICADSHKISGAYEFCSAFCDQLCEAKHLINTTLWLISQTKDKGADLYYSCTQKPILSHSGIQQIDQIIAGKELHIFDVSDPKFASLIVQKDVIASFAAFIKLQDYGLLGILISNSDTNFETLQLDNLLPVARQFANAFGYKYMRDQIQSDTAIKNHSQNHSYSDRLFRKLFQQSPTGIVLYNGRKILKTNQQFCQMLGYTIDFLLDKNIATITHPDDRELYKQYLDLLIEGKKKVVTYEKRYIHKDGSTIYTMMTLSKLVNIEGNLQLFIGNIENISNRKKAEKALLESEERYRLLFENAFDCITIYDYQKAELINCNQATLDYFQCSREEFFKVNQRDLSAPIQINGEPLESRREFVTKELAVNKKARYEWIHKIKDGSLRTSDISTYQLPAPNENIWVTVMHDITESKKSEEALRSSEERLSMILEAGQIGTWDWNIQTGETIFNQRWAEMLGYKLEEIEPNDKSFDKLVHPDDAERVHEIVQQHLNGQSPYFELEARMISKDGEAKWIYDRGQVMTYDEQGKPLRAAGIHLDITRQKQVESALIESKAQQGDLLTKIELANKELNDFAYMVSHDLKAPLRAIASLAQWIHQDFSHQMDPQGQQHLEMLLKRTDRMHSFIEGILEYSRIGLITNDRKKVDLNICIQGLNELFAPTSTFKIELPRPLPTLLAEKVRMDQLFQNLISNAIKYNDKELPVIKIQWEDIGSHFKFLVSDNGPGIPAQFHKKIFKLFQTLQPRDKFESTGIGLTIVKRIVSSYQGTIKVHSTPKKGTTFEFTLKK